MGCVNGGARQPSLQSQRSPEAPRTPPGSRTPTRLVRPVHHRKRLGVALLDVGRAVGLREHAHPRLDLAQLPGAPSVYPVALIRQELQARHVARLQAALPPPAELQFPTILTPHFRPLHPGGLRFPAVRPPTCGLGQLQFPQGARRPYFPYFRSWEPTLPPHFRPRESSAVLTQGRKTVPAAVSGSCPTAAKGGDRLGEESPGRAPLGLSWGRPVCSPGIPWFIQHAPTPGPKALRTTTTPAPCWPRPHRAPAPASAGSAPPDACTCARAPPRPAPPRPCTCAPPALARQLASFRR